MRTCDYLDAAPRSPVESEQEVCHAWRVSDRQASWRVIRGVDFYISQASGVDFMGRNNSTILKEKSQKNRLRI